MYVCSARTGRRTSTSHHAGGSGVHPVDHTRGPGRRLTALGGGEPKRGAPPAPPADLYLYRLCYTLLCRYVLKMFIVLS